MRIKAILLLFFIFISALAILVNTASATAINITDADAVYETNLSIVNIPTTPQPVKTIFIVNDDVSSDMSLSTVSIPTHPLPIKEIFIINDDATSKISLSAVSIPTQPLPLKEIFIHNEDTEAYNGLTYPKELMNDTTPPIITNITVTNITDSSATIKWNTEEFANSVVKYGEVSGIYTESVFDSLFVKNHAIELTGLLSGTAYYFVVNSTDQSGNSAESSEYSFTTSGALKVFDTGLPENPYPSIFGTHNGTIKPNQTITVSKLYTYPCPGTGGHSEYAMIWNETIGDCAVAEWNGYIGDYHNISFNKTLTLEEGVIYNYTIRTGSYPQIHHTDNRSTSAGFITCSEFIDANGKRYVDWIPAIRLE